MALRISTNIPALSALRHVNTNIRNLSSTIERLSSGLRINRAADDPSGLAVAEGLRAEISGFTQAVQNAEQATDLIQTAEGGLSEISAILIRMKELATQASSDTVTESNRASIEAEVTQLRNEIDRIASGTQYNNQVLLTGYGNAVQEASSTALTTSDVTGVTEIFLSGATADTYRFVDTGTTDDQITLGSGMVTQTLDLGSSLDEGRVATGTTVVANFDRLGISVTLDERFSDGDLNDKTIVIEEDTGGTFQIGPDAGSTNRMEMSIADMRSTGSQLNLGSVSVSAASSAQNALTSIDTAVENVSGSEGIWGLSRAGSVPP